MGRASRTGTQKIVVVGNGMVGHRFCERLVEREATDRFEVTVFGEEPRAAYDRVHLSEFFAGRGAEELALTSRDWYTDHGLDLRLGRAVVSIDRERREIVADGGERFAYDALVLSCGSAPFVLPIPGVDLPGVFLYRTIDDLGAIQAWARQAKRAAVIGGGLLGLEAAKALLDLGLETHVIEYADRLMPRQLDSAGATLLQRAIESLGVQVHLGSATETIIGEHRARGLRLADRPELPVDMVILSAGIRPRDELAREAGLDVAHRGGIIVNDALETSDAQIFAIGECAVHRGVHYGLVGPGYEMANVLCRRVLGEDVEFEGADLSTQLKLLGVAVATFGDPFADQTEPDKTRSVVFEDALHGVYQKLLVSEEGTRLLGGILVGDTGAYPTLYLTMKQGRPLPERPQELLFGSGGPSSATLDIAEDAQVCSCNSVTRGEIVRAIADNELNTVGGVKACTKAGTGCGGCLPLVSRILEAELARAGREVDRNLCPHFSYSRQELFWIVKLGRIEAFDALLESHGQGDGCEVCRPAVASILAATWNDLILEHAAIQDTNDRFLANIQRGGTYSVIPRVPGGEITPEKLMVLGRVAKKYDLYCKITGGQRIDLLGARVDQLPLIWEELVEAGFESGHAYGKAMRTVKSCIGSTWCRFGVQDSTGFAIRVEERYRGIRAPHKLKGAVSGCIRECAEAKSKDFGIIATEEGWNVYLCGNGGANPRHADLVATDLSDAAVVRLIDRFLMFYIQTAKPLQRTARWLEELDGGVEYLKSVIIDDALGICEQLERDMEALVDSYRCEWKAVVEDPALRARFRSFAGEAEAPEEPCFVRERGQKRPADWPDPRPAPATPVFVSEADWQWRPMGTVDRFPRDSGAAVRYGKTQIAIYNFSRRGQWFATENRCPHRKDEVLARGLLGDHEGEPKVACPLHKRTFSLQTGKGLSDPSYQVQSFPVELRGNEVWVKLPDAHSLERARDCSGRPA